MTERELIRRVREEVVERDGSCRVGKNLLAAMGRCWGPSEWAHFNQFKRFKTRNLPPEERHTAAGSLMLCRGHHASYDRRVLLWGNAFTVLTIEALTEALCNGPLRLGYQGRLFNEPSGYAIHAVEPS